MKSFPLVKVEVKVQEIVRHHEGEQTHLLFDFDLDFVRLIPQVSYRPSSAFRLTGKYKLEQNRGDMGTSARSDIHDFGLELTYRGARSSNLQFGFNYVLINFSGPQNSPVEFEMLQGLRDGRNILWNLNYTRRISESIDILVNYNGRKPSGLPAVNTLSVQMRALF